MKALKTLLTCVHDLYIIKHPEPEDSRLIIEVVETLEYGYNSQVVCWAQPDGSQATLFTSCRDYLNDSYMGFLHDYSTTYFKLNQSREIGHDKLRLIFTGMNKERLEGAVHAINLYSKLAGWKPAQCIHGRMQSTKGKWLNAYLLEADNGWMRYPQMVSALVLFVRVLQNFGNVIGLPNHVKDAYSLQDFWEAGIKTVKSKTGKYGGDISYLKSCNPYMITILTHEKEIFPEELPKAWQRTTNFHHRSGINSFISDNNESTHKQESEMLTEIHKSEVKRYERC